MTQPDTVELFLSSPEETAALGKRLATAVAPGDCVLLDGQIGAGKTHFARALIQEWLALSGKREDVPSPTFTLVQTYSNGQSELWHADLYRLSSPGDVDELGIYEAFEEAIVLVEWPDRLAESAPQDALRLTMEPSGNGRLLHAKGPSRLLNVFKGAA